MNRLQSHPSESQLDPDIIEIVQWVFSTEADRVVRELSDMKPELRNIALWTLEWYQWAMAANEDVFIERLAA